MIRSDEATETCDAGVPLVIKAMCCIIAADGRVSGSEIDTVFDALAAIGYRQTPEAFRELVITTCKRIHGTGVFAVADSLSYPLASLGDSPLGLLLLQLQEDVIHSDNRVTASEQAVANKFRDALAPKAVLPPPVPEAALASLPLLTERIAPDWRAHSVSLTTLESLGRQVLRVRHWVDETVGSRALVAMCAGVVCGTIAVFATGSLAAAPVGVLWGVFAIAVILYLGSDARLHSLAVETPRARALDVSLDMHAAALVAALQVPAASSTTEVAVPEADAPEVGFSEVEGESRGFDTALALVGCASWPVPYRAKVVRRVFGILRGSRQRGGGRTACRCTSCGRKYWFVVFGTNGYGVICPYCGKYQRATLDWKLTVPQTLPTRAPSSLWLRPVSVPSYTGGPVQVRGYVNKHGTWVSSHARARPRRRRW